MQNFQVFWWLVFFVFTIIDQFFSSCVMVWMIFYLVFLGTPENSNGGEYRAHYILFLVFCIWCGGFIFVCLFFEFLLEFCKKKQCFLFFVFFKFSRAYCL